MNYQFGRPPGQQAHDAYPYQQAQFHQGSYGTVPFGTGLSPQNATIAQEAFDYNRNAIPGLTFGAIDPAAAWQPWSAFPPVVGNPPSHAHSAQGNQLVQGFAHPPQIQQLNERMYEPPHAEPTRDNTVEEGELSEGMFEDLYEPEMPPEQPGRASTVVADQGHTVDSVRPTPDVSLGPRAEHAPFEAGTQPPYIDDRDRSGSYSPYLSPRELRSRNEMTSQDRSQDKRADLATLPPNGDIPTASNSEPKPLPSQTPTTLTEAKTRAKDAILRLWSVDVRFQNYIDEGIDEKVVRSLFTDLGLEIPTTPPAQGLLAVDVTQRQGSEPSSAAAPLEPLPQKTTKQVAKPGKSTEVDKSEERKDRIARKLAAKRGKPSPSTTLAAQPAEPNGASVIPASTQTLATSQSASGVSAEQARKRAEKDRILQEKMEALKKSRELRAQKAAEKAEAKKPSPDAPEPLEQPVEPDLVQEQQATNGAAQHRPPIPGLFLSATQSVVAVNPRKRPVASDLIDFPPTSHKRPFGHNRDDTSLVINVSDDSDSEDIEMEIGSPQEGPPIARHAAIPALKKTTSFRSFPPLSEKRGSFPYSAPPPQSTTPPTGAKGGADPGELDRMHRSIDEMKRKIAEAEERRRSKAKKPTAQLAASSSNEPSASSVGDLGAPHPLRRAQSASALGLGDSSPDPAPRSEQRILPKAIAFNRERRMRIASDSLPALEASLKAKATKLRLLKSEVARLEREVDEDLAEKTRITEEMMAHAESDDSGATGADESSGKQGDSQTSQPSEESDSGAQMRQISPDIEAVHRQPQTENAPRSVQRPSSTTPDSVDRGSDSKGEADADNVRLLPPVRAFQDEVMRSSPEPDDAAAAPALEGFSPSDAPTDSASADEISKPASHADPDMPMDRVSDHAPLEEMRLDGAETEQSPNASHHLEDGGHLESDANTQDTPLISSGLTEAPDEGLGVDGETERASEPPHTVFVPYESVLKSFLSYRFHPNYNQVGGGLRSLTYSNKIDSKLALCPEELADQICRKGADCEFQHLDSLVADDSEILLQLGNSDKLEGEQKQQYNNGLRELLADLRSRNIKDFKEISEAVIGYRARFFGDKSKILPLGDVSI